MCVCACVRACVCVHAHIILSADEDESARDIVVMCVRGLCLVLSPDSHCMPSTSVCMNISIHALSLLYRATQYHSTVPHKVWTILY